jgi:hypothetical protein
MAQGRELKLRLTLLAPPAGVLFSLQDEKSAPVAPVMSDGGDLSLDLAVRVDEGPRWLGPFVRREGPRRFVYFAAGTSAGQHGSPWTRRGKVRLEGVPSELLQAALAGRRLEAVMTGTARDGGPACATIPVSWRLAPD